MGFAAFLVGLVGPLMARWLASVGLSLVAVSGYAVALSTLKSYVLSSAQSLPSDALMLGGLLGLWTSLGMMLGTITFCVAWAQTKGFWMLAKS